jgi:imidazolonepropionase
MMTEKQNEMILHNISQLLTLESGPQRGDRFGELGIIEDAAAVLQDGVIIAVGKSKDLIQKYPGMPSLDVDGHVVMPGFVDPHTHLVWAGDRAEEFDLRLQGKTYMEILNAGGGIISTVSATRVSSLEELLDQTRLRAQRAFAHGTTTMEVKTGYGLTFESEIKQIEVILKLDAEGPLELTPTFLAAHAVPPEYKGNTDAYVELVSAEMLPAFYDWWRKNQPGRALPFVDVFCEVGVFDLEQSRRILGAAKKLGFPLKIHVDEFERLGGASLAVELGAVSADHLVKTSMEDINALGKSDTVAVSLPGTPFGLNEDEFTPAKALIDAGAVLALATDINPGTSWCESMQFILALACRKMGLTPAQAIAAGTINAAAAVGQEHRVGSIEVGKQADLLILDTADYRHLGYRFGTNLVASVIKRGKIYPVKAIAPSQSQSGLRK